jgi:L-2-hydroxyglutarate oxidase LhgO
MRAHVAPGSDETLDVVVIGAGVVGLACAARCALRGDRVLVIERNARIAQETSSRNSGVIHAGLYHPPGSLKATLCVRGRELLYARAQRDAIAHRKLGKLVVACEPDQLAQLEQLQVRAQRNGAGVVRILDKAELARLEPHVHAQAALFSPETGIVDAHALASSYWNEAARHAATLALRTEVVSIEPRASELRVITRSADRAMFSVRTRAVVNAAGLAATGIARSCGIELTQHACKGDYFALAPRLRGIVSRLVYPLPSQAGLGIHVTLGLDGSLHAGPDASYVDTIDYTVDPAKRALFAAALRRYLPALRADDLTPGYAGIRPKLHGAETSFHDFVIRQAPSRVVHLLGIESPGLTASEAIAEQVAAQLPQSA